MKRVQVLELLAEYKPMLADRYRVTNKALRAELRPFIEQGSVYV